MSEHSLPFVGCQRAYSIRTRIKTFLTVFFSFIFGKVREHIPLEQGLRRFQRLLTLSLFSRQRAYSIRTRIKTAVHHSANVGSDFVREHIPLEQGLRPRSSHHLMVSLICQRAYSIRTRIKTISSNDEFVKHRYCQRAYSIRTRIKTLLHILVPSVNCQSESIFHQNKD